MTGQPRELMIEILSSWNTLSDLAKFAAARHGFANSDIGHGVIYPEDLDDHDREVEGLAVPPGYVMMYAGFDDYEFLVPEPEYLSVLAKYLKEKGLLDEARQVEAVIAGIIDRT